MAVSGKSSDAGSGCNYQASSTEDVSAAASSADHQLSAMLHQQHHLQRPHQFQTEQARALPPQYDSLTSLNNNNSYTSDSDNDAKYDHLSAHLLGHGHPYHNHHKYHLDNHHYQQQLAHYQLDYRNTVPGQSYGMTSSSSASAVSGSVSGGGYCSRGQFELAAAEAAAYSAGEPRSQAGYWTTSCGVGTNQLHQPPDIDDHADVKPTLLDASSYVVPAGQYPPRHQGYLPGWYQAAGYGWGVPGASDATGGYYTSGLSSGTGGQSTSPPMHHILRGVYNTLQVCVCHSAAPYPCMHAILYSGKSSSSSTRYRTPRPVPRCRVLPSGELNV